MRLDRPLDPVGKARTSPDVRHPADDPIAGSFGFCGGRWNDHAGCVDPFRRYELIRFSRPQIRRREPEAASATITGDDEALLEELYNLAKRLDDRMDTVERLVASDNPEFRPARIVHDSEQDNQQLRELEQLIAEKKGASQ